MGTIEVIDPGPLLTIQDLGRKGYQKYGIPVSGVMDDYSARILNILLGNEESFPLLEFFLKGPKIKFLEEEEFAVGGECEITLNGNKISPWTRYSASKGDVLEIGPLKNSSFGYLAFSGGIRCERILGSCSTYLRANLGKKLERGDRIKIGRKKFDTLLKRIPSKYVPKYENGAEVRVVLGPNLENFTRRGIDTFLNSEYEVTSESDRMGYRLKGPKIEHSELGADVITDAIPLGAIQVPKNGLPIVMMVDRQTTGGYAKIGVVIRPDVPKVAQLRPGGKVKFSEIEVETARKEFLKREQKIEFIRKMALGEAFEFSVKVGDKSFEVSVERVDLGKISP